MKELARVKGLSCEGREFVFVVIKKLVESLEELLLVVSTKFDDERRVVGFLFLFHQASTDFILTVVGRIVSLFLKLPTECSFPNVFLVHPRRVSVVVRSDLLSRSELVKGLGYG